MKERFIMFTNRHRLKNLYAVLMCVTLLVGPSVNAGVWQDDFNEEKLSINGDSKSLLLTRLSA